MHPSPPERSWRGGCWMCHGLGSLPTASLIGLPQAQPPSALPAVRFVSTTITVWDLPPLSSFLKCLLCSDVDKRRAPGDPASFPGQSQTGLAPGHTSLANQVPLVPDNLRNLRVMMRNQIGSPKKSLSTSYLCLVLLDPLDSYSHPRTNDAHSVAE